MAETSIITGQYVRISQTPASIGERFVALLIDYVLIVLYVYAMIELLDSSFIWAIDRDWRRVIGVSTFLPVLFYSFLCESFNQGQSPGKKLMKLRVTKLDGSSPGIGAYLLRWLLFPIDGPMLGGIGLLFALLTKNRQRIGDLAAGTMVIREKEYRKIQVSLDEFDYLTKDYHPSYPQAADLTLEQINLISRTLSSAHKDRSRRIGQLSDKVCEVMSVTPREENREKFLQTVLRDYQYYALEEL